MRDDNGQARQQTPKRVSGSKISGNAAVSKRAAKANIAFLQQATSGSQLIFSYLDLVEQNKRDKVFIKRYGKRIYLPAEEQVSFDTYMNAKARDHLLSIITESLPKDASSNIIITAETLKPAAENGLLDNRLDNLSFDEDQLFAKMVRNGTYANQMRGHSLRKYSSRLASKRTQQKYRPSLPSLPKGDGGVILGTNGYDDGLEFVIDRYHSFPSDRQSKPKIDWKNERGWVNKQNRRRKHIHRQNAEATRFLKQLDDYKKIPYTTTKLGNKTFTRPVVPKYTISMF